MVDQLESGYFRDTLHSVACSIGRNLNQGAQRTTAYRIPQSDKKTKHLLLSRVLFDRPDAPYLKDEVVVFVKHFYVCAGENNCASCITEQTHAEEVVFEFLHDLTGVGPAW